MMINSIGSERHLIESLDRISRNSARYSAVYINISKLKIKNRHPRFIKILAKLFDGLVGAAMGAFFVLSNGDFVIIGTKISPEKIKQTVENLKKSMKNDPIIHTQEQSSFVQKYTFPQDLPELYMQVSKIAQQKKDDIEVADIKKSIQHNQVEHILQKLFSIDFTKIIKHQSVVHITSASSMNVINQEFYVAAKDLNNELDFNIDISSNKWLYTYLLEEIDKKVLSAMFFSNIKNLPPEISLNLNMSSIYSDEFNNFANNFLTNKISLVVEVSLIDVFTNLNLYFEVKEFLHQKGHKILIDGITPDTLSMINIKEANPDFIKIFWEPLMEFDKENTKIKDAIDALGEDGVVLAKCHDIAAIKWGKSHGISVFQGPYVDELETAIIKAKCNHKNSCTNQECLKRRKMINGKFRDECQNLENLETLLDGQQL